MKKTFILSLALFLILICLGPARADCSIAQTLYEKALAVQNLGLKINLLEQCLFECPGSYHAALEMGKAFCLAGDLEKAKTALGQAAGNAQSEKGAARAHYLLGQIFAAQGDDHRAAAYLRSARKQDDNPEVENKLKSVEMRLVREIMPAEQIVVSIETSRKVGVIPSVDLRVNFEFDRAVLNDRGCRQAAELGRALSSSGFDHNMFLIIGHTDSRGTEEHNQWLSEQRARTVVKYLIDRYGIDPGRIQYDGLGKKDLLYKGNSADDHALNRRVEVRVQ